MDWDDLLRRLRANDPQAWDELTQCVFRSALALLHLRRVVVGTREAAEDIAQQVLIILWPSLGLIQSGEHLRHWVGLVTRQRVADYCRDRRHWQEGQLLGEGVEPPGREPNPAEKAEQDESLRQLQACIERLPQPERAVLELRLAGWTLQEIADLLGWAGPSGPFLREVRARGRLRECLEGQSR
jgi:RNA polymerase sigma factor (sigma-70 family)